MVTPLGKRRDVSDAFAIIVGSVAAGERTIVLDVCSGRRALYRGDDSLEHGLRR